MNELWRRGDRFALTFPWIECRSDPNFPDVAYEVLELPDGGVWWAPCGTADPCPADLPHRYYRHLPTGGDE